MQCSVYGICNVSWLAVRYFLSWTLHVCSITASVINRWRAHDTSCKELRRRLFICKVFVGWFLQCNVSWWSCCPWCQSINAGCLSPSHNSPPAPLALINIVFVNTFPPRSYRLIDYLTAFNIRLLAELRWHWLWLFIYIAGFHIVSCEKYLAFFAQIWAAFGRPYADSMQFIY